MNLDEQMLMEMDRIMHEVYKGALLRLNQDKKRGFKPNLWPIVQGTLCGDLGFKDPHTIGEMSANIVPIIEKMLIENGELEE